MSYLEKLDGEELQIIMNHPDGMKCWQTDYKILRDHQNEMALNNFNDEKAILENLEKHRHLFDK